MGEWGRDKVKRKEERKEGELGKLQKNMKSKKEVAKHHASGIVEKKVKSRETEPNRTHIPFFSTSQTPNPIDMNQKNEKGSKKAYNQSNPTIQTTKQPTTTVPSVQPN